ncbi:hypothetical protein L249_2250 [Ophiocordyceps polyrhachis-furcata BCC 54312]|uniref:Uncharacterized protein n=1 Tax=Ophiocordyceps polyrhachis-furcata BCC 54312 TaxID=1330021 RepID=A0A367LQ19_9HYPO|nr:hypothetical protein L249_2250 [Ophiocordyceps polyrhachis-furcata BCC 54312]
MEGNDVRSDDFGAEPDNFPDKGGRDEGGEITSAIFFSFPTLATLPQWQQRAARRPQRANKARSRQ